VPDDLVDVDSLLLTLGAVQLNPAGHHVHRGGNLRG
jgi:hypothetical protein